MLDWLAIWGVSQVMGFAFGAVLKELATDAVKDYVKDFFKDVLGEGVQRMKSKNERDPLIEAYGKALKEFLQLVQQELEDADYIESTIQQYIRPLENFVKQKEVASILGSAFKPGCSRLDVSALSKVWLALNSPYLPAEFNWERVSKRYIKKVKAIIQESEELRILFDAQVQTAAAEKILEQANITTEFDLERYAEGIRKQYSNLRLESLDTTGYAYNELKLWQMFVPQNARECQEFMPRVYELPKVYQQQLREQGEINQSLSSKELERFIQNYYRQQTYPILEIIQDSKYPYLVILGDPGSGKSTLLQYLALRWAEKSLKDLPNYPIPLLVELRTYTRYRTEQSNDFLDFFHSGSVPCRLDKKQLHEYLKAGQVITLIDGLDEVFDLERRDDVITAIDRFTNDYPKVRVVVTSRWLGYKAERLKRAGFRHFMLQDLELRQIRDFVQRWHDLTYIPGIEKDYKCERLRKAITESSAIRELAGNPLLITMMAVLNRNQELPRDRPELYNQSSRVLLHQWDIERALIEDKRLDPKTIDYKDKQIILRQVAHYMQTGENGLAGNLISQLDLEKILTNYLENILSNQARVVSRLMINQLRTRNFILCLLGMEHYAFVHRTFLEYFCAWEIVWQFKETQTITFEQLKCNVFGKYWSDETWNEILCLISGMIDIKFSIDVISYLTDINNDESNYSNLFLAAQCLSEIRNQNEAQLASEKLLKKLKFVLSQIGQKKDSQIIEKVSSIIVKVWKDDLETLKILESLYETTQNAHIIRALAKISEYRPEALDILRKAVLKCYTGYTGEKIHTGGHFSNLGTKIYNKEALISSLKDLGITVKTDADVRGYHGQWVKADVVAVLKGEYDLGFILATNGSFNLIADLAGVALRYNQTTLITLILQVTGAIQERLEYL